MTKFVHCSDIGFDCEGVIRAENEEELMKLVAQHAGDAHELHEITPELAAKVRSVIQEE